MTQQHRVYEFVGRVYSQVCPDLLPVSFPKVDLANCLALFALRPLLIHNNNNVFADEEVTTKPVLIYVLSFNPFGYIMIGLANCLELFASNPSISVTTPPCLRYLCWLTESKFASHPAKQMKSFEFSKSQESTKVLSNEFDLLLDNKHRPLSISSLSAGG